MRNTLKVILVMSLGMGSMFGMMNVANASMDNAVSKYEQKAANAPDGYEKYGIGEVKADGQWVNDN